MKFDHARFFDAYRRQFGPLREEQVGPLDLLVGFINDDATLTDYRHAAYMLATVRGECGDLFTPVEEAHYLKGRVKNLDAWRKKNLKYYPWYGRGYPQTTWYANYLKAEKKTGIPFTKDPSLMLVPNNAYQIMSRGMQEGWFTGKSLYNYIKGHKCDYWNARRIINPGEVTILRLNHKARKFQAWAKQFDSILSYAEVRKK